MKEQLRKTLSFAGLNSVQWTNHGTGKTLRKMCGVMSRGKKQQKSLDNKKGWKSTPLERRKKEFLEEDRAEKIKEKCSQNPYYKLVKIQR